MVEDRDTRMVYLLGSMVCTFHIKVKYEGYLCVWEGRRDVYGGCVCGSGLKVLIKERGVLVGPGVYRNGLV